MAELANKHFILLSENFLWMLITSHTIIISVAVGIPLGSRLVVAYYRQFVLSLWRAVCGEQADRRIEWHFSCYFLKTELMKWIKCKNTCAHFREDGAGSGRQAEDGFRGCVSSFSACHGSSSRGASRGAISRSGAAGRRQRWAGDESRWDSRWDGETCDGAAAKRGWDETWERGGWAGTETTTAAAAATTTTTTTTSWNDGHCQQDGERDSAEQTQRQGWHSRAGWCLVLAILRVSTILFISDRRKLSEVYNYNVPNVSMLLSLRYSCSRTVV